MSRTRWLAAMVLLAAVAGAWLRNRWPSSESSLDCPPHAVRWVDAGGQLLAHCGPDETPGLTEAPAPLRLAVGGKLSLNRATETELAAVPGIGPHLAKALVEVRGRRGAFVQWEEVDAVKGVGPAKLRLLQQTTSLGP
jgi:competence protein ComEA